MKKYHRIYHYKVGPIGSYCYAFEKYDGSNIRSEWSRKLSKKTNFTNGFGKFGSRNQMITHINQQFGEATEIFMDKYSEDLDKTFRTDKLFRGVDKVMVYGEYFGKNSFSGQHVKSDPKDLVMFDIDIFKKGFLNPKDFIKKFGHLHIPNVIYQGEFNEDLINSIKINVYNLSEGVVCKGVENNKVWMVKIKTDSWINKIKEVLGQEALIEELNGDLSLM
jgi:RNA ligase